MTADRTHSEHFTFSQRYGYEPLPAPMRLEELSDDLRREIWNAVRGLLLEKRQSNARGFYYFLRREERIIERVLGRFTKRPESEISTY